jgi:hypothetical protein
MTIGVPRPAVVMEDGDVISTHPHCVLPGTSLHALLLTIRHVIPESGQVPAHVPVIVLKWQRFISKSGFCSGTTFVGNGTTAVFVVTGTCVVVPSAVVVGGMVA